MFFEKRSVPIRGSGYLGGSTSGNWLINSGSHVSAGIAMRNSDIRTAVTVLASDVARVTFSTSNKSMNKLLDSPSRMTGRYLFMQSMIAQLLLDGNAYAIRREDDKHHEFWEYVRPSNATVYLADDGQSLTYDFNFDSKDESDLRGVESENVIHFRLLGIDGGLTGRSPLEALGAELSLQKSSRNLALNLFGKTVNPTSILTANGKLNKKQKDEVRDAFEDANSGENAGRALVLDSNFTFEQLEIKSDVAKILDSTDWTREQIAKVFMIPVDSLGSESEHSNAEQIRGLYNTALGRYIAAITDELTLKLGFKVVPNVREAIDLDGSQIEQRTVSLLGGNAISKDVALEILKQSHSDLVTEDILNTVQANGGSVKGGEDDSRGEGNTNAIE